MSNLPTEVSTECPTIDLSAPKEGEFERFFEGKRYAWDFDDKTWRILPSRACPPHINPFHPDYRLKPPFVMARQLNHKTTYINVRVDANGIRMAKASDVIHRQTYAPAAHLTRLAKLGGRKPNIVIGRDKKIRFERINDFMLKAAKRDAGFKVFFDENGNPKSDMIEGFYMALWRRIFADPIVMGSFVEQLMKAAVEDPLKMLAEYKKLTGLPMTVNIANSGSSDQFVKLNIIQNNGEDDVIDVGGSEDSSAEET